MMPGSDKNRAAVDSACEPTVRFELDFMESRTAGWHAVREAVTDTFRKMGNQSTSKGNIENLDTTTDAQTGKLLFGCVARQGQFCRIATTVDHVHRLVRWLAIPRGSQIAATGQDQPVQPIDHGEQLLHRRQQHGGTAGAHNRIGIAGG
jgi:hypothetical protein